MNAPSLSFPSDAEGEDSVAAALTSTSRVSWPVAILGLPFTNADASTIADALASAPPSDGAAPRVVLANLHAALQARANAAVHRAILDSDVVLCCSRTLALASIALGNPLPGKIHPREITGPLLHRAHLRRQRVYYLEVDASAAVDFERRLRAGYPGLTVAGSVFGTAGADSPESLSNAVRQFNPDLLLVHVGGEPRQHWLAQHTDTGAALVVECFFPLHEACGFSTHPAGMSWLRIAATEIHRCLASVRDRLSRARGVVPALVREWRRSPRQRTVDPTVPAWHRRGEAWIEARPPNELTRAGCSAHHEFWRFGDKSALHCALIASGVTHVDATGLAVLSRLRATLSRTGHRLVIIAPSDPLQRALSESGLAECFLLAADFAAAKRLVPALATPLQLGTTRSLAWCGEIIASNVDDVWQMTSEYIRTFSSQGTTLVIIDLSRLRHLDNAGAGLMLRLHRRARDLRAQLVFVRAQPAVFERLRLAGLDHALLEGAQ